MLTDLQIFVVKTSVNFKPTSLLRPYFYVIYFGDYWNVKTLVGIKFGYSRQAGIYKSCYIISGYKANSDKN